MGNYIRRYVLAPHVSRRQVIELAEILRAEQLTPTTLTLCSLDGKRPRLPHAKTAQQAQVRKLEIDSRLSADVMLDTAKRAFGNNNFLYIEKDDEGKSILHPNALWLKNTFKVEGLTWLLDNFFDDQTTWNEERFYALPGNPPDCDVTLPIHTNMLRPAKPGQPRPCPICGQVYTSKFSLARCRNDDCRFGYIPFETAADAYRIIKTPVGNTGLGQCPRCNYRHDFVALVEQCHHCGRVMEATNEDFKINIRDNCHEAYTLMKKLRDQNRPWWRFW